MREFELSYDIDPVEIIGEIRNRIAEERSPEVLCAVTAVCVAVAAVVVVAVWHAVAVHVWAAVETVVRYALVVDQVVGVS